MSVKEDIYRELMIAKEELENARVNFEHALPEDFDVVNAYLSYCEKRYSGLNVKYRALHGIESCIV